MATSPPVVDAVSASAPVKLPIIPLLVAVVFGVVLAVLGIGGAVYYLAHTGRLPIHAGIAARVEPGVSASTHMMALEPLLVNLADEGGRAYLRVALTLRLADGAGDKTNSETDKQGKGTNEAAVRDTALQVLGRQTADGLLAPDGKERLKVELKAAMAERNADLKVTDLFFTEFLVQR
jgi:flagellar FliL protein